MIRSQAIIRTGNAGRYLVRLAKHWRHKFDFTYTPEQAYIPFSPVIHLDMSASPAELTVQIETPGTEDARRMEHVFASHIERFAFREPLTIEWQRETLP